MRYNCYEGNMRIYLLFILIIFIFIIFGCVMDITDDLGDGGCGTVIFDNSTDTVMPSTQVVKIGFKDNKISDFNLDNENIIKNNPMARFEFRSFNVFPGKYTVIVQTIYSSNIRDYYSSMIIVNKGETITIRRKDFPSDGYW